MLCEAWTQSVKNRRYYNHNYILLQRAGIDHVLAGSAAHE